MTQQGPSKYSIEIVLQPDSTFGYQVLRNDKPFIVQPNIPAVSGNKGFSSPEKARKCAEMVVGKLEKNQMPPTVTLEDLEKSGLLN